MDYRNTHPPLQEGKTFQNKFYSSFALSLQGESHAVKDPAVPCQDYSNMRYVQGTGLLIAAIADGVGSCQLSHWGAYTAVTTALDNAEASLSTYASDSKITLDSSWNPEIKRILVDAFRAAQNAVEELADSASELVYHFQSTLTLAIYDGANLLYGHVGDDGIVVQMEDGSVEMLTVRLKGEEASSVYPLQSGEKHWKFGRAAKPVAGFLMATDGVLDAFVTNHNDYFGINYNKGVCYSFMGDAIYTLAKNTPDAPDEALSRYQAFLMSPEYRSSVTDDLTMIAVVSNALIQTAAKPRFSFELWTTIQQKSYAAKKQHLSGKPMSVASLADLTSDPEMLPTLIPQVPEDPIPVEPEQDAPTPEPVPTTPPAKRDSRKSAASLYVLIAAVGLSIALLLVGILIGRLVIPPVSAKLHQTVVQERDDAIADRDVLSQEKTILKEAVDTLTQEIEALKETANTLIQENATLKEAADLLESENNHLKQEQETVSTAPSEVE